jgi:hypothetical protein
MEYVYDIRQKGILRFPQDMRRDRKDVVLVKFL